MARSQNGWIANDRSLIKTYSVPGTSVRLPLRKGDAATVLLYVAERFNREVEKLRDGWCWGYAERKIRGSSTTLSNHASGTAEDFNAPAHWLGAVGTFSKKQRKAIGRILDDCDGCVRWGGNYSGRKDEMHFELIQGPTAVGRLADKVRGAAATSPKEDPNVMIHASYGLTLAQPLPWDTWTRLLWDVDYSGAKRNRNPGHVADLTGWAMPLGLEGLEVQGLRPATIDALGNLLPADQLQVRLEVHDWDDGRSSGVPWIEMADDMNGTPGGQFRSVFKSKWLKKGQHVYWSVCPRPGDDLTNRPSPTALHARYTVHQEER